MRANIILTVAMVGLAARPGVGASLEDVSPRFGTNTTIVWQAPTNHLPKQFWTYRRLPQVFSAAAISNGIVLAGFERKGFPRPSTNDVVLWADHPDIEPRPPYFDVLPRVGQMSFTLGDRASDSPQDIARDAAAVRRAMKCAALLGVAPGDLAPTNAASAGVYGVFLARQIDGVRFFDDTEGLQIQFGKDGKIRQFSLQWPKLERGRACETASPAEIIRCIRGQKAPVCPVDDERDYLGRIKGLAHARKFTITQIRALYGEGLFGDLYGDQTAMTNEVQRPTVGVGREAEASGQPLRRPYLTPGGDLVIPFDSDPKYHWWKGGQSVKATLAELRAVRDVDGQGPLAAEPVLGPGGLPL